jgi:hypothetical protein
MAYGDMKKMLGFINDNKMHLSNILLFNLYLTTNPCVVINVNNKSHFFSYCKIPFLLVNGDGSPFNMIMFTIELVIFHLETLELEFKII